MARSFALRTVPVVLMVVSVSLLLSLQSARANQLPLSANIPDPNASSFELERQGDQLRAQKHYLDSIDFYKAALAKQPSVMLWNKIGVAYLFLQRYDEADKCFLRAMRLDKKAPEAYNNHGFVEQTRKNYGKAIKAYKKALSLRPASPTFHYNLGAAYFGKHQFDLAAQAYHKAYELDPEIFERVSRMGIMAQTTSPEDRAAFAFMVARMYAHSGDYDHALLYLRKAMEEGYRDIKKVYSDDEFATLRTDKRFSELMSQRPQALQ